MKKYLSLSLALGALVLATSASPAQAQVSTLVENFTNVSALTGAGWVLANKSNPAPTSGQGTATWAQGTPSVAGYGDQGSGLEDDSFAQVGVGSTRGNLTQRAGTVSNWLITPELNFANGGSFSFYARTLQGNSKGELLEVRQSNAGASAAFATGINSTANPATAAGAADLGVFTTLVGTAGALGNPDPANFPDNVWTQYTFNVAAGSSGRLAIRYFATNGGVNGSQAQFATIDTLNYQASEVPEPTSMAGMLLIGGLGAATRLRNKSKKAQA
jgi:hypothetical protein